MPKKAETEAVDRTIEAVRAVAQDIGYTGERGELVRLAKALDERGEKTPSGGQWHYGKGGPIGLTRFIKAHMPEGLLVTQQSTVAREGVCLPREHEGTQASLSYGSTLENTSYASDTQQPTSYDASIHENTELTVSHQNTGEHDMGCETPAYESIQPDDEHVSAQSATAELVTQENTPAHETVQHTPEDTSTQDVLSHESAQSTTEMAEAEPVPQQSTMPPILASEMTAHNVIQLDEKEASDLKELLVWWRERRDQLDTMQIAREERPAFKGPRDTTKTVRLSEPMAKAAEKYATKHRSQTGGTFSGLCEWLIWQALGRSEKFVVQENTE